MFINLCHMTVSVDKSWRILLCITTPYSFQPEGLLLKFWRLWIGKIDLESLHGNGTKVQYHYANFENIQSDINSFDSGVLQNHCVLNIPIAQQRGVCAIITEKCWFYVGQMEQVISNIYLMKEKINLFPQINGTHTFYWTEPFPVLGNWHNGIWWHIHCVPSCLFILLLNYVLYFLGRFLTAIY